MIAKWINDFEEDSHRFSFFLQGQLFFVKKLLLGGYFKDKSSLSNILNPMIKYIDDNYTLIRRHYILLWLFSLIIYEASAIDYKSIRQILEGLVC